jgi:hypothetical protein
MNKAQSRDELARNRVTFLMKTPIKTLIRSTKYKKLIKEFIKEHGRAWWYFCGSGSSMKSHRTKPWLWRFKDGKE